MDASPIWNPGTRLGEGLLWHAESQRMFFVDIRGARLLAWSPSRGTGAEWAMPQPLGWLLPCADGGWVAGLRDGIARVEFDGLASPRLEWVVRLHEPGSPMRLNDAKADAFGSVWFGTMHHSLETEPHGSLYRLHADGRLETIETGLCVPNGPAVSPDGHTLLHSDSARRLTWAYTLGPAGAIEHKRLWRETSGPEDQEGFPDGMCFAADGTLWQARWGAGCVVQLDPAGHEIRRVFTGAPHTSNCCFGGPGLQDLYITTAHGRLGDAGRAASPASGQLLRLPGVGPGTPAHAWGGRGRITA